MSISISDDKIDEEVAPAVKEGEMNGLRNPCLTMHQPWASLLVHGIKRVEGRSWPAPLTGRLWIHAAGKIPDSATIIAMEDFYREIYAVNGITDIKFPEQYPVSRLIGCVEVVGCVKCEELIYWEEVPESVRLEGLTEFCWLCEQPQKLIVPFEMRGYQRVYNLERRIFDAAVRGLCPVRGPLPVKFPLPDPQNPFSLKPGSLASTHSTVPKKALEKPPALTAAISGAQAAATQFSNKSHGRKSVGIQEVSNGSASDAKDKLKSITAESELSSDSNVRNDVNYQFGEHIGVGKLKIDLNDHEKEVNKGIGDVSNRFKAPSEQ